MNNYIKKLRQSRDASRETCDALMEITVDRIGPATDRTYLAKLMGEAMRLSTSLDIFLAAVNEESGDV